MHTNCSNILRSMVVRTVTRKDHLQPRKTDACFQEWVKNTGKISLCCLKNVPSLIQSHPSQQTDQLYYGDIKRPLLCWRHNCSVKLMVSLEQAGDWGEQLLAQGHLCGQGTAEIWLRLAKSQPWTAQHTLLCLYLRQISEATEQAAELRWGFAEKKSPRSCNLLGTPKGGSWLAVEYPSESSLQGWD